MVFFNPTMANSLELRMIRPLCLPRTKRIRKRFVCDYFHDWSSGYVWFVTQSGMTYGDHTFMLENIDVAIIWTPNIAMSYCVLLICLASSRSLGNNISWPKIYKSLNTNIRLINLFFSANCAAVYPGNETHTSTVNKYIPSKISVMTCRMGCYDTSRIVD